MPENNNQKDILNIEEACSLLGISAKTFAKILRESDVPGRKIGREWKFSRQALIDWVGNSRASEFIDRSRQLNRNKGQLPKDQGTIADGSSAAGEPGASADPHRAPAARIVSEKFSIEED